LKAYPDNSVSPEALIYELRKGINNLSISKSTKPEVKSETEDEQSEAKSGRKSAKRNEQAKPVSFINTCCDLIEEFYL
jgi:hypothetical protein